jgi:hypothetical protein
LARIRIEGGTEVNQPRIYIAAIAAILVTARIASATTVFHQLADFETGVPEDFAPQNGAILTQESLGATTGASSLGVQFTDTRPGADGPQQHLFVGIGPTNNNFAKWQEAATLQATTDRRFAVAYDMFLDFNGTSLPAGATVFASDFRYNQDPDPAAPVPIPGFQDTGGEFGVPTRFSSPFPATDESITVVVPFDNKDNPRSFFVNPNPTMGFYQLQLGHKYDPPGLGGSAKVYYDNFRILEYESLTEQVLFSWETPDDAGTPVNEQLEGWTTGSSASGTTGNPLANHTRAITTVGATHGASAMRIGTPNGIAAPAFTWGSQVVYTQAAQVDAVASALDAGERIELDVTFTEAGNGTATFFSFFMHISDSEGHFYQTPASQFNDLPNLELGEERTVTIQFGLREFRNAGNPTELLTEDPLLGTTSLAIGIGTNEDSISTVTISVDKMRIISEPMPEVDSADFDDDGDIDGADFLTWQRGLGTTGTATPSQGDANNDGSVTADDLAIWKAQFGLPAAGPAVGVVPECGTLALAVIGGLAGFGRRRFSSRPIA